MANLDAHQLSTRLNAGITALGMALSADAEDGMLTFLRELERWNRAYNLTAIRDVGEMIPRHLLDSLAAHPFLAGQSIADVGSGAGLPGIPLALANPARSFVLVEGNSKKVRFLRHVLGALALRNVRVEHCRLEDYPPGAGFDTVVARALAPLPRLLELAGHLCAPGGRILAMKGRRPDDELEALPQQWRVELVARLSVPQLEGERHAVVLRRAHDTAPQPRDPTTARSP